MNIESFGSDTTKHGYWCGACKRDSKLRIYHIYFAEPMGHMHGYVCSNCNKTKITLSGSYRHMQENLKVPWRLRSYFARIFKKFPKIEGLSTRTNERKNSSFRLP
jgi:hypothetical protein